MALRKTMKKWEEAKNTALRLQKLVNEKFNEEDLYAGFIESIEEFLTIDDDGWLNEIEDIVKEYE